jgi:glycosyltransferase involved in cell wall biosynthesis
VNILRIADVPNSRAGGMSRMMLFTGDALRQAGHRVDYLFREDLGPTSSERLRRFVIPWRLPGLVRRRQAAGAAYDVVEIHEPIAAVYCLARAADRWLPPVVALSHGVEARGRLAMLDYRRRKQLPVSLKQRFSPLSVVWQANLALRHSDAVVCLNAEDAAFLRRAGVPARRIVRGQTGVGLVFLEAGAKWAVECPESRGILFVGSWVERKGILDLVPAVAGVLRQRPDWGLTVAGCGAAEAAVRRPFPPVVQGQIDVVPHVEGDEALLDVYRRHSVCVLPSYFEGQPLSMLEAAALGLALVTTDCCGMRDFIRDGETGLLVRPGDAVGLGACLSRLAADRAEVRRLGDAARRKAQEFTWENAAARLSVAYELAASSRRPSPRRERTRPRPAGMPPR